MYWILATTIVIFIAALNCINKRFDFYKTSMFFIFVFLTGNYYNGIDWINYQELHVYLSENKIDPSLFYFYEPFYIYFDFFLSKISGNYYIVTFVASLLGVLSLFYILSFNSFFIKSKSFFIALMFVGIYTSLYGEQVRQGIAFAILLPFLMNIKKIKPIYYFTVVLFSSLFHASAIFAVFIYFIPREKISQKYFLFFILILICICICIFNIPFILPYLPLMLSKKLEMYLLNQDGFEFGIFAILDVVFIMYIYIIYIHGKVKDYSILNYVFVYFFIHLIFYIFPFLRRLSLYLLPFVFVYITNIIFSMKNNDLIANSLCTVLSLYYLLSPVKLINSPYSKADFFAPKNFYLLPFYTKDIDLDHLRFIKCYEINKVDPNFCRGL